MPFRDDTCQRLVKVEGVATFTFSSHFAKESLNRQIMNRNALDIHQLNDSSTVSDNKFDFLSIYTGVGMKSRRNKEIYSVSNEKKLRSHRCLVVPFEGLVAPVQSNVWI